MIYYFFSVKALLVLCAIIFTWLSQIGNMELILIYIMVRALPVCVDDSENIEG